MPSAVLSILHGAILWPNALRSHAQHTSPLKPLQQLPFTSLVEEQLRQPKLCSPVYTAAKAQTPATKAQTLAARPIQGKTAQTEKARAPPTIPKRLTRQIKDKLDQRAQVLRITKLSPTKIKHKLDQRAQVLRITKLSPTKIKHKLDQRAQVLRITKLSPTKIKHKKGKWIKLAKQTAPKPIRRPTTRTKTWKRWTTLRSRLNLLVTILVPISLLASTPGWSRIPQTARQNQEIEQRTGRSARRQIIGNRHGHGWWRRRRYGVRSSSR